MWDKRRVSLKFLMRWLITILLAFLIQGCGSDASEFSSEKEEMAYLASLSNPTPKQWKRRKVLAESTRAAEVKEEKAKAERMGKYWIEQGKKSEDKGQFGQASSHYGRVSKMSSYAEAAAAKQKECEAKAAIDRPSD
jgi:hypothetical protein